MDLSKVHGLAHNFKFISICYITYNCAFNKKLKLPSTYYGGADNQGGGRLIRRSWWRVWRQEGVARWEGL